MTDIFQSVDARNFLRGKKIVYLGGSITRGLYKDMVWLLNSDTLLPRNILGSKGEDRFPDLSSLHGYEADVGGFRDSNNKDRLHGCGSCSWDFKGLNRGRNYTEFREYENEEFQVKIAYKFITSAWSDDTLQWLRGREREYQSNIDIILMGSCLWDVNRRGPTGPELYTEKLQTLVSHVNTHFPRTHFVWMTSPPNSSETNSKGMSVQGLEFQNFSSRYAVVEANHRSAKVMKTAGFNVIDFHFYLQAQAGRRNPDGIHWSPAINRLMTQITLTHLALTLRGSTALPGTLHSHTLNRNIESTRSNGIKSKWNYSNLRDLYQESQYLSPRYSSLVDAAVKKEVACPSDQEWSPDWG